MTTDDDRHDNAQVQADGTTVDTPAPEPEAQPQFEASSMSESISHLDVEIVEKEIDETTEEEEYHPNDYTIDVEEPTDEEEDFLVEDDDDDEEEEEGYSEEELQKPYGPVLLPMPDLSEFSIPLPSSFKEEFDQPIEPPPLAPLPNILHVQTLLKPYDEINDPSPSLQGLQVFHMGRETGLTGEMQAMYVRLPPGTRLSRPVAHQLGDVIVYCISGSGLLWQNGWTFPFNTTDAVGWKAGTGITHTIINDTNADGGVGEDINLLIAYEDKLLESNYYPLDQEFATSSGKSIWKDPPPQGDLGPHPGVPSLSPERGNLTIPPVQLKYRPSNVVNTITELDGIGEGELFANATSLSQETALSGRFGCNFEVPPPGARSSEPHAHSLEDELVYVVSGSGNVWLNGHVSPVNEGDVIGFPAGTGIAHCFINDSNANGEEGNPLMLWILGQNRVREGDLVFYPLKVNEAANVASKRWWPNAPLYELGPHDGHATRPLRF
ncbi:hypothetical protein Clacol_002373 [Clathrus columnatus]|uniref:Cupin type-2 domain-containing protein n=1 Tax=Clathrus columnatus TaxID=1419009 RepID=A0AAV5A5A2_9AGAM|nr:hypothetical protein Clacol_002373 [Clathrus columnatus]